MLEAAEGGGASVLTPRDGVAAPQGAGGGAAGGAEAEALGGAEGSWELTEEEKMAAVRELRRRELEELNARLDAESRARREERQRRQEQLQ